MNKNPKSGFDFNKWVMHIVITEQRTFPDMT